MMCNRDDTSDVPGSSFHERNGESDKRRKMASNAVRGKYLPPEKCNLSFDFDLLHLENGVTIQSRRE